MQRMRVTAKMQMVMTERGIITQEAFVQHLIALVNDGGLTGAATELGISKATLGYWLLKLGIHIQRIAIGPSEQLKV